MNFPNFLPSRQGRGFFLGSLLCLFLLSCSALNTPKSLATPTPDEGLVASLVGRYALAGTNPDGSAYRGQVSIQWVGDQFQVTWVVGDLIYTGTGVLERGTLVVTWRGLGGEGFAIYDLEENGVLSGKWFTSTEDPPGMETLTPLE